MSIVTYIIALHNKRFVSSTMSRSCSWGMISAVPDGAAQHAFSTARAANKRQDIYSPASSPVRPMCSHAGSCKGFFFLQTIHRTEFTRSFSSDKRHFHSANPPTYFLNFFPAFSVTNLTTELYRLLQESDVSQIIFVFHFLWRCVWRKNSLYETVC